MCFDLLVFLEKTNNDNCTQRNNNNMVESNKQEVGSIESKTTGTQQQDKMMMGGWMNQDPQSQTVQRAVTMALDELKKRSNSMQPLQMKQVLNAKTQVVNGINYMIEMDLNQGSNSHKQRVFLHETPQGVMTFQRHEMI